MNNAELFDSIALSLLGNVFVVREYNEEQIEQNDYEKIQVYLDQDMSIKTKIGKLRDLPYVKVTRSGKDVKEALNSCIWAVETEVNRVLMTTALNSEKLLEKPNKLTILSDNFVQSLEHAQCEVEKHRFILDKFITTEENIDLFKTNLNAMDSVDSIELRETGLFGNIWGINIYGIPNSTILNNHIFCLVANNYLGVSYIKNINVTTQDQKTFVEIELCLALLNPAGVSLIIDENFANITVSHKLKEYFKLEKEK